MRVTAIVDDINPVGQTVHVALSNDAPSPDRGLVEVVADLGNGKTATSVEPYDVVASGKTAVSVEFESEVVEVIEVSITEGPDPIPQLR